MIRFCGKSRPEFSSAARTRSRDSRTARSGSPTSVNADSPRRTSTSTVTSWLETPSSANVVTQASTVATLRRPCDAWARECDYFATTAGS